MSPQVRQKIFEYLKNKNKNKSNDTSQRTKSNKCQMINTAIFQTIYLDDVYVYVNLLYHTYNSCAIHTDLKPENIASICYNLHASCKYKHVKKLCIKHDLRKHIGTKYQIKETPKM